MYSATLLPHSPSSQPSPPQPQSLSDSSSFTTASPSTSHPLNSPSPNPLYSTQLYDDEDGDNQPYSSYSSLLHSYSERQSDDEDELADEDRASMSERLTAEMRQEEEDERRRERREREVQSGAQSERVEDAEMDEQDRLREAGSQGLFGSDSLRRVDEGEDEDEEDEEKDDNGEADERRDEEGRVAVTDVQDEASSSPTPSQQSTTLGKRRRGDDSKADSSSPTAAATVTLSTATASSRLYEFAVPDLPSTSSKKRAVPPFSLPVTLLPPSSTVANVSPISTDYAAAANFSPAPRPSSSSLPPPLSYTAAYAAPPSFPPYSGIRSASSIASPPHSRSPSMPPLSPRASPRITWPPSSPRMDSIHSVSLRVEQWQRLGRVQAMMKTAHAHAAVSVVGGAGGGPPGSLVRKPSITSSSRLPIDSREPLLTIDRYLRRRYLLRILDSDMIVRGVVYNKTNVGLIITITQIETDAHTAERTAAIPLPTLSSQWPDTKSEDDMRDLEELEIRGECHLSEIQGAAVGSGDNKASEDGGGSMLSGFDVGDCVRCLVISVDVHSEKVYLSMHNARLKGATAAGTERLGPYRDANQSPSLKPLLPPTTHREHEGTQHPTVSGLLSSLSTPAQPASAATPSLSPYSFMSTPSHSSLPVPYGFPSFKRQGSGSVATSSASLGSPLSSYPVLSSRAKRRRARPANYLQWLRSQPLFLNPAGLSILLTAYAINQHGSLSSLASPPPVLSPNTHTLSAHLRQLQNTQWAKETVARGISLSRNGSYANAMRLYQHALEIEPTYVEAVVATGACWVLQGQLRRGKEEFEKALAMDASNGYARKYLEACNERLRKESGQQRAVHGGKRPAVSVERKEQRTADREREEVEVDVEHVDVEEVEEKGEQSRDPLGSRESGREGRHDRTEEREKRRVREQHSSTSSNSSNSSDSSGHKERARRAVSPPLTDSDRDKDRQRDWVELD